jgi:hypothetical protein
MGLDANRIRCGDVKILRSLEVKGIKRVEKLRGLDVKMFID